MKKRTKSRVFALQMLYEVDLTGVDAEEALSNFWQAKGPAYAGGEGKVSEKKEERADVRAYAEELVRGVVERRKEIDGWIEQFAEHWKIDRMACVDRNILRLGAYELIFEEDVPVKVALNEAVELAKVYGAPDSSKFVNGVLDKIAKTEGAKRGRMP
ncbi:MAG: transcription antitermination factor NusB [Candidatus Omnitrophica bacterium]|nr:transcription antitermination factor NusB [Candidatus Omnitrophota bacterium]